MYVLPDGLSDFVLLWCRQSLAIYLIHEVSSMGKEFLVGRMISFVMDSLGNVNGFTSVVCCLILSFLVFILAFILDLGLRRMPLSLVKKVIG